MRVVAVLLFALAAACNRAEPTASTKQPLVATPELAEVRFGVTLTRTAWSPVGNHHPVANFVARGVELGEGQTAALTPDGAVIVRLDGKLELIRAGRVTLLASDALPDLAVSNEGKLAYASESGLHLLDKRGDRGLVSAFAEADRPLFLDERTLLFVGAAKPGVSSFYKLSLDDEAPVALKSDAIPAFRDHYRVENGLVHFHDGASPRTLEVR